MELQKTKTLYNEWFNSPYYHKLYQHRDFNEAEKFIDHLCHYLNIKPHAKILDLACGWGRHAVELHSRGLEVTGIDLSEKNIEYARQFSEEGLGFYVRDMREVHWPDNFDFVLNLFTSFGYFSNKYENARVLEAAVRQLKPGGKLVVDFMNTHQVVPNLVPMEEKQVDDITFYITRHLTLEGFIEKTISFYDQGEYHQYKEKVKAITRGTFTECLQNAGFQVKGIFGNYSLQPFDKTTSDRMIFLAEK